MSDSTQSYDEFAAHYDQTFESWEASILRQATVLGGILQHECGQHECGLVREEANIFVSESETKLRHIERSEHSFNCTSNARPWARLCW
jgi:hypothetical protein